MLMNIYVGPDSGKARLWVIFFSINALPYVLLVSRSSVMGSVAAALVSLRKHCS